MATSIFAIHPFGDLVSPPVIGKISDLVRAAATQEMEAGCSLRTALLVLPAVIAVGAALWWRGARGHSIRTGSQREAMLVAAGRSLGSLAAPRAARA